jgi:hypothetical protein
MHLLGEPPPGGNPLDGAMREGASVGFIETSREKGCEREGGTREDSKREKGDSREGAPIGFVEAAVGVLVGPRGRTPGGECARRGEEDVGYTGRGRRKDWGK